MGFRSTMTTESYGVWPDWFVYKHRDWIQFGPDNKGPLAFKREIKCYGWETELHDDIRKVVNWANREDFIVVYLHECGGISRCEITRDGDRWSEPEAWKKVERITHEYCYRCSSTENITAKEDT